MTRIPTLAQQRLTLNYIGKTQTKINDASSEVYTHLKSQKYSGVQAVAGRLIKLDELQSKSETYIKNIDVATTRLKLMENNMSALDKLTDNYINLLETVKDNLTQPDAQKQSIEYLKNIASLLNESDGDRYLFGGTQLLGTTPVKDLSTTAAIPDPIVPSLSPSVSFTVTAGTNFAIGDTITSSSGGTAVVSGLSQVGTSGRVYLQQISGPFNASDTLSNGVTTATAAAAPAYPSQDTRVVTYSNLTGTFAAGTGTPTSNSFVSVGTQLTSATGTAVVEQVIVDPTNATKGRIVLRTLSGTFDAGQQITQGANTATLTSSDYYTNPNAAFDKPIATKIADDLTVTYGITANNKAFDKVIRVLNYFQSQTPPMDPDQVDGALATLRQAKDDIRSLRADVAFDQLTMNSEKTSHTTAIALQKDTRDTLIKADDTAAAASLNALSVQLQASYSVLSTVKTLSLVNFLR